MWRLADVFTLPALEKAAVEAALRGFEELPAEQATGAEVVALVQEDRLVAKSEEAVFQWVRRWWEAGARPEAELLAMLTAEARALRGDGGGVRAGDRGCVAGAELCGKETYAPQCSAALRWRPEAGAALGLRAAADLRCGRPR